MATTATPEFAVASRGGFPTLDEFEGTYHALIDVHEFALSPLLERIARPIAEAFESDEAVDFSYEDLGRLSAFARHYAEMLSGLSDLVASLDGIQEDVANALQSRGHVGLEPRHDEYGRKVTADHWDWSRR